MPLQELCNRIQYNIIIHHLRHSIQLHPYCKVIPSNGHLKNPITLSSKNISAGFSKKNVSVWTVQSSHGILRMLKFLTFLPAVSHECKKFTEHHQTLIFIISSSSSSRSKRFEGAQELTKAGFLFIIFSVPERTSVIWS